MLLIPKCQMLPILLWTISPTALANNFVLYFTGLSWLKKKTIISIEYWYWFAKSPMLPCTKQRKLCHFASFVKRRLLLSACVFLPLFNSIITAIQICSSWTHQMSTQSAVMVNVSSASLFCESECCMKRMRIKQDNRLPPIWAADPHESASSAKTQSEIILQELQGETITRPPKTAVVLFRSHIMTPSLSQVPRGIYFCVSLLFDCVGLHDGKFGSDQFC